MALPHREGHDTTNVVVFGAPFLLAEVSNESGTAIIDFGHNIEEERLDVIEKGFVIQEHLGEQAKVLAIDLVLASIDLEDGNGAVTVDLVTGRMSHLTFRLVSSVRETDRVLIEDVAYLVPSSYKLALHVLQTKLAQPQTTIRDIRVLLWKRSVIPSLYIKVTKSYCSYAKAGSRGLRIRGGRGWSW